MATLSASQKPLASTTTILHKIERRVADSANARRMRLEFKIGVEKTAVDYLTEVETSGSDNQKKAARALLTEHRPLLASLESSLARLDAALATSSDAGVVPTAEVNVMRDGSGRLVRDYSEPQRDLDELVTDVQAEALRIELDEIQSMVDAGRLSLSEARDMREDIYLLQMGISD